MDLVNFDYEEEMHMPVFHMRYAKKAGGKPTVPVLVTAEKTYSDSMDILRFLDQRNPEAGLFPKDPELRQQVENFVVLCNEVLGTHARRIIYSYLLLEKDAFFNAFPAQCPRGEVRGLRFAFPLFRWLVRRGYRINPDSVQRSCVKVNEVFAKVEQLLSENGDYLFGNTLSAADIAFACTSVPVVVPGDYFVKLPSLEGFPPEGQALINSFRDSPAGLYAQKLFREDRP